MQAISRLSAGSPNMSGAAKAGWNLPRFVLPLLIGIATMFVTVWEWQNTGAAEKARAETDFAYRVQHVTSAIETRMQTYEQVLRGGVALFSASREVTRAEWRTYVDALEIQKNFPGIQGMGYAVRVPPTEKAGHIRDVRREGFPDYTIKPAGVRSDYTAILYLEPFDRRNRQAFGYDMFSQQTRREAMIRARDTGAAAMSGRVILVQEIDEDLQSGFLTYLPVYRTGAVTDTPAARAKALQGYVYAPFRMNDLMRGILGRDRIGRPLESDAAGILLEIFDGAEANADTLMYRSGRLAPDAALVRKVPLFIDGRSWTLRLSSLPTPVSPSEWVRNHIVLIAGVPIAILLMAIIFLMQDTRNKAVRLAEKMTTSLRQSEEQFRTAMDYSFIGMALASPDGHWLQTNAALTRTLGYTEEELVGSDFRAISHPEDIGAAEADIAEILSGKTEFYQREKRYIHKDGHTVWTLLSVSLVRHPGGAPRHFITQIQDITERREQDRKIRSLNADLEYKVARRTSELQAANKELETFAYTVSHDLRAPLRSINGFTQALFEDYGDSLDDQGRDYTARINAACGRMGTLIDDILNLSRVFRADLNRQDCDISDIARSVVEELAAGDPERRITVDIARDLTADVDETLLRVALQNLIGNAWKFTAGAASPRIAFGVEQQDGESVYFVRDNGAGFDMKYADKLFQPFQRLHAAEEFPGTGIGLATVARIVHKHGGRIWPDSTPGRGTTLFFTLAKG